MVLTDQDFRDAALGKSASIEILDFVETSSIDPRYFETPYYLTPIKGSEKPYALLCAAVRKTNVVGIGKIVTRNTQHLVGIKATGEALMLEIMRFQNELVETDEFRFPKASEVRPQELEMAERLVHNLAADFDPKKVHGRLPDVPHDQQRVRSRFSRGQRSRKLLGSGAVFRCVEAEWHLLRKT